MNHDETIFLPVAPADTEQTAALMPIQCSVCGSWLDVKPGIINAITHSLCPECFAREIDKINQQQS